MQQRKALTGKKPPTRQIPKRSFLRCGSVPHNLVQRLSYARRTCAGPRRFQEFLSAVVLGLESRRVQIHFQPPHLTILGQAYV